MKQRILVGLIWMPPVMGALWWGAAWWAGLVAVVAILGGIEFYGLMKMGGFRPFQVLGLPWLVALVLSHSFPAPFTFSLFLTFGIISTLIYALYQKSQPIINWAITAIGAIYIGTMLGQALAIRLLADGFWWMVLALLVTWSNDTVAYFTGVSIGRHKLWPRLSPKKTWEGTVAGWLCATFVGWMVVARVPIVADPWIGAITGLASGILALCGDLSISVLKRQVGAKDSGKLLPGHGGVLDRLDSLLFVIPFIHQVALLVI